MSGEEAADELADGFAVGAAGGFGLGGFDDGTHVFFAGGAGLGEALADEGFQFFGGEGLGEERFEDGDFLFFLEGEFRAAGFFELLDAVAAFFDLFLDDNNEIGVGEGVGFFLDLNVAEGGLEETEGSEALLVPGEHAGFDFLGESFLQGHGYSWGRALRRSR